MNTTSDNLTLPLFGELPPARRPKRKRNIAHAQSTAEARQAAFEKIEGKRSKRHRLILETLTERPMTAREVLRVLISQGHLPPTAERNQTSPRISELAAAGAVEPLEELRQVGSDPPASVWKLTPKGELLLDELRKQGGK